MDQPVTRYARSGDLHIAYQIFGSGPVDLVFIPNWFSNIELMWQQPLMARVLQRLGRFARVLLFDQRGSGASDPTSIDEVIVLEERARDIVAVLDAAQSQRAALLSFAMTGPLACFFAASHGDRTHSLVLVNAGARRAPENEGPINRQLVETLPQTWATPGFARRTVDPDEARVAEWFAFYRRMSMGPGAAQAMFRAYFELDTTDLLTVIDVPTLVIRNERSDIPAVETEELAEKIPGARYVVLPGAGENWASDVGYVDEVERFLSGRVAERTVTRVLMTMLFTDVVGSTEKAAELGDRRWLTLLSAHDRVVAEQTERFGGNVRSTEGDGSLMTFDGPARAIRCARAIQEATAEMGIDVRAGLHTGEVEMRRGDIGGIALHIGARVGAMAKGREILVSSTVKDLVVGSGIAFEDRGTHTLKGVPDEWRIFAVTG